jgi:quercetin dioxygenase-like cupin family protein
MDVQGDASTMPGPENWFRGDVTISPITNGHGAHQLSLGNVRFAPGARTAWHAHSISQTLHVTDGEGRVQPRGGDIVTIRPGDIVNVASGEWHWHGAAPDHAMSHLSLTEGDTEWGDHVTDTEYHSG